MSEIDYHVVGGPEVESIFLGSYRMRGLVKKDDKGKRPAFPGTRDAPERGMKTAPMSRPAKERTGPIFDHYEDEDEAAQTIEKDPEDTREMLWLYLQGQLKETRRANEQIASVIREQTQEIGKLRDQLDTEDQRHVEAQVLAAEKYAEADKLRTEKQSADRRLEAKIFGALASVLVIGFLILAGARVSGAYNGVEFSAGQDRQQPEK